MTNPERDKAEQAARPKEPDQQSMDKETLKDQNIKDEQQDDVRGGAASRRGLEKY
jgi:hypothetical protein